MRDICLGDGSGQISRKIEASFAKIGCNENESVQIGFEYGKFASRKMEVAMRVLLYSILLLGLIVVLPAMGVPGLIRASAAGTGAEVLVIVSSAPQSEFSALKGEPARIEQTLAFEAGATPGPARAVTSAIAERPAALDTPCRADVFTREECEKRKRDLANPPSKSTPGLEPASTTQLAANETTPSDVVRFTRLSVRDPGINNIEAVSFLVPSGWRAEGGVRWFPDFFIQAVLLMKITDPQTGATIEFLPLQNFTWEPGIPYVTMHQGSNYLGNIVWPSITDVPQFIQFFYAPSTLPQLRNARVVKNEDLPEVAALIAQVNGVPNVRAGKVRYEYQIDGRPWEEDVYVTLTYTPVSLGTIWSVTSAYSFRAPKGQLDPLAPIMNTTINSTRLSLEWFAQYQYVQMLFKNRIMQGIKGAGDISKRIARTSEEIQQMFADSYRRSSESQDRINRSFTEYIRGVETHRDPYENRPVQLPSGYSNMWVSRSGEYMLSNQAGFNPNVGSNIEWRRLE